MGSCAKTVISFNNKIFKQTDGVSMGSPLDPVLAKLITTELEMTIVKVYSEEDMGKSPLLR